MPSGWLYCVQGHPPRSGPALLRTMRGASGEHSTQLALHAGLVRKKTRNYNGWAVFMRFLTLRTPRKGFLGYFFAATLLVGQNGVVTGGIERRQRSATEWTKGL